VASNCFENTLAPVDQSQLIILESRKIKFQETEHIEKTTFENTLQSKNRLSEQMHKVR